MWTSKARNPRTYRIVGSQRQVDEEAVSQFPRSTLGRGVSRSRDLLGRFFEKNASQASIKMRSLSPCSVVKRMICSHA